MEAIEKKGEKRKERREPDAGSVAAVHCSSGPGRCCRSGEAAVAKDDPR